MLRTDGSVEVEGVRYTDADSLGKRLAVLKARRPKPEFEFVNQKGADFRGIGPALALLIKTGQVKLGFITSPRGR